jgi:hypothetical protein
MTVQTRVTYCVEIKLSAYSDGQLKKKTFSVL